MEKCNKCKIKNQEELYLLYSCDEWKSHASMSLIGLFKKDILLKVISKELSLNNFEYDGELNSATIEDLEDNLDFAFIQSVAINEVL